MNQAVLNIKGSAREKNLLMFVYLVNEPSSNLSLCSNTK